jgi:hypothetical protein
LHILIKVDGAMRTNKPKLSAISDLTSGRGDLGRVRGQTLGCLLPRARAATGLAFV